MKNGQGQIDPGGNVVAGSKVSIKKKKLIHSDCFLKFQIRKKCAIFYLPSKILKISF